MTIVSCSESSAGTSQQASWTCVAKRRRFGRESKRPGTPATVDGSKSQRHNLKLDSHFGSRLIGLQDYTMSLQR